MHRRATILPDHLNGAQIRTGGDEGLSHRVRLVDGRRFDLRSRLHCIGVEARDATRQDQREQAASDEV